MVNIFNNIGIVITNIISFLGTITTSLMNNIIFQILMGIIIFYILLNIIYGIKNQIEYKKYNVNYFKEKRSTHYARTHSFEEWYAWEQKHNK